MIRPHKDPTIEDCLRDIDNLLEERSRLLHLLEQINACFAGDPGTISLPLRGAMHLVPDQLAGAIQRSRGVVYRARHGDEIGADHE